MKSPGRISTRRTTHCQSTGFLPLKIQNLQKLINPKTMNDDPLTPQNPTSELLCLKNRKIEIRPVAEAAWFGSCCAQSVNTVRPIWMEMLTPGNMGWRHQGWRHQGLQAAWKESFCLPPGVVPCFLFKSLLSVFVRIFFVWLSMSMCFDFGRNIKKRMEYWPKRSKKHVSCESEPNISLKKEL